MVDRRPRGVLGVGLGLLRGQGLLRAGARIPRHARRRVVPRRAAELRRAHARRPRGPRHARGDRVLADPRPDRPDLRRARRPGRPGARRARPARRRARRPGRRVRAEHPRGAGRVPGLRVAGRDLGLLRARVRGPQRRRPLLPGRAHRPDHGRRLHLRQQGDRQVRRGRGDPEGAADAAPRRRHQLRALRGERRAAVVGAPGRARARRVRPRALRPPAVRAVLLGHHRAAEGHRARPRRDPARALQDAGLPPRRPARRLLAVVHHHRVGDVEHLDVRAAAAGRHRGGRRQPALPRSPAAVADRGRGPASRCWAPAPRT